MKRYRLMLRKLLLEKVRRSWCVRGVLQQKSVALLNKRLRKAICGVNLPQTNPRPHWCRGAIYKPVRPNNPSVQMPSIVDLRIRHNNNLTLHLAVSNILNGGRSFSQRICCRNKRLQRSLADPGKQLLKILYIALWFAPGKFAKEHTHNGATFEQSQVKRDAWDLSIAKTNDQKATFPCHIA